MTKSHRLFFSCALRCRQQGWSDSTNLQAFGPGGGVSGAGFNFELVASLEGEPQPDSGWMIPETDFDALLWKSADLWDHQFLNECDPQLKDNVPTSENLTQILYKRVAADLAKSPFAHLSLVRLRLVQGGQLWVDCFASDQPLLLTQKFRLQCVHRHHNPDLSWEENKRLYNKCATVHGHDYQIEISVRGKPDGKTGLVMARNEMEKDVNRLIVEPYNRSYLNELVGNTSGEILTEQWSAVMRKEWGELFAFFVVRETRKNSFVEATSGRDQALLLL